MVLTKDRIARALRQLREMNRISGEALINGVQSVLTNIDDSLSQSWIIVVRGKSKQETREIYRRVIRLLENWSEGPFNLDFDLWMSGYISTLDIYLKLLQHLLQIQAEFHRPNVVREEVSHTLRLLSDSSTSSWARFDKSISDKYVQDIITSAVERSERHEDIQNWREFDEIIRLVKQHLVKYFLPPSG